MRLFVHLRLCLQNIIHTVCHQDVLICQRRCGHSFGSWKEFINDFQKNFPRLTFTSEEWTHLFFFKISSEQHIQYYSRYLPPSLPRTSSILKKAFFLYYKHFGCCHCTLFLPIALFSSV